MNLKISKRKTMNNVIKRGHDPLQGWFDDFFGKEWFGGDGFPQVQRKSIPAVNISETENAFEVSVAAPGLNKDDISIEVEEGILVISSEEKKGNEEVTDNFTRKEFSYSSFERRFTLPDNTIDEEKILANYEDGILKIALPKLEEKVLPAAQKIEIK